MRVAIRTLPGGLSLRRRRCGRIHHRSGLGRPGLDLRERRHAGRDRALSRRQPVRAGRHRPGPAAQERMQMGSFDTNRRRHPDARSAVSASGSIRRRGDIGVRAQGRALSVRPGRCRAARAGLLRGLQHPGLRAGAAAARDRHQARGDRRVRRPRFHPGADRVRAGARPAGPAAREHLRLHDARASPRRITPRPMRSG